MHRQSSPPPAQPSLVDSSWPVADPLVGLVIADRYRILGPLGSGGMGVVYKVEHVRIGKLMAMKLLAGELSREPGLVKRFKREALLASRLSHPNTVQVFDFGQADGLTYLVMELVPGEDLARIVRAHGPLPAARAGRLVLQICGSLAEAHRNGIIHRDLKPENVLVVQAHDGKSELAKVCDFGLAKLRESGQSSDVTGHGAVVGTPYYMSPEQIRGEDVDARTDIYALGAMLYRLLTGVPPFKGNGPMAVFAKHLTEVPIPPSEQSLGLGIPKALDDLVLRALAKRREDRFVSIEALQAELAEVLRTASPSSMDGLLDSGRMRHLAQEVAVAGLAETLVAGEPVYKQSATRDEVAAYERKLARQRTMGQLLVALGAAAVAALGAHAYAVYTAPVPFQGVETEPNNTAASANVVPFGSTVRGQIGKRQELGKSDRDFYAFEVPPDVSLARLTTTALPNFATCTWLYRAAMPEPLARFCTGAPGQDLELKNLRVEPGRYLLLVLQDMDPYGEPQLPSVFENVSDDYALSFGPKAVTPGEEIEPNDSVSSAMRVRAGSEVTATAGFVRDEDVFCPDEGTTGSVRWIVRDGAERARDGVIEVSVGRGDKREPLRALIHNTRGPSGKLDALNVMSPFASPTIKIDGSAEAGCLRIKLSPDPWQAAPAKVPLASREPYFVKLEVLP